MKHLDSLPICSNGLFTYKLDIKDDLISQFQKEKFKSGPDTVSLIGEDLNILKKSNTKTRITFRIINPT